MNKLPKLSLILLTVILLMSLPACSSKQSQNATCDFVYGANDNQVSRERQENKHGSKSETGNEHIVKGLIAVVFSPIIRSMSSNSNNESSCP